MDQILGCLKDLNSDQPLYQTEDAQADLFKKIRNWVIRTLGDCKEAGVAVCRYFGFAVVGVYCLP